VLSGPLQQNQLFRAGGTDASLRPDPSYRCGGIPDARHGIRSVVPQDRFVMFLTPSCLFSEAQRVGTVQF